MSESGTPKDFKWWVAILLLFLLPWGAWVSTTSIKAIGLDDRVRKLDAQADSLIGMKSQVDVLSLQQRDVISPVVEQSLRELRQKTNEQYEAYTAAHQKLIEIANQNRSDIRDVQKDVTQIKELLKSKP